MEQEDRKSLWVLEVTVELPILDDLPWPSCYERQLTHICLSCYSPAFSVMPPMSSLDFHPCEAAEASSFGKPKLVIANTLLQQHKRRRYTWTSPDGQHRNQIDYILCSQRWRSSIQSAKTRSGADCGSDHELLIAKLRLKLKKVGKITRPFRYDLNQIPYDLYSGSEK